MHNFLSFSRIIDNSPDNTAAHQRARLLQAMKFRGGVTTLEAMRFLDIVDPRARIVELRKEGFADDHPAGSKAKVEWSGGSQMPQCS